MKELKLKKCEDLLPLMDLAHHGNWFYPYKDVCVISEKPTICKVNEQGRVHNGSGPSVAYGDGFCVYALNGVRVPDWLACKAGTDIDPVQVMALSNAEQRKEGIRKLGIDKFKEALNSEVIHTFKDYKLLTIEFEGRRIGPYLEMVNPSTGQTHIEGVGDITSDGVDRSIKTCQEALAWRGGFQMYSTPIWMA